MVYIANEDMRFPLPIIGTLPDPEDSCGSGMVDGTMNGGAVNGNGTANGNGAVNGNGTANGNGAMDGNGTANGNGTMNGNGMVDGTINGNGSGMGAGTQIPTDSINPALLALAMGFVPVQAWEDPYEPELALVRGTLFPALDKPFLGEEAVSQ